MLQLINQWGIYFPLWIFFLAIWAAEWFEIRHSHQHHKNPCFQNGVCDLLYHTCLWMCMVFSSLLRRNVSSYNTFFWHSVFCLFFFLTKTFKCNFLDLKILNLWNLFEEHFVVIFLHCIKKAYTAMFFNVAPTNKKLQAIVVDI